MSYFGSNSRFSTVNKDAVKSSTVSVVKPSTSIKSIVNKSPFTYGAKKITFSIKPRTSFWSPYLKDEEEKVIDKTIKKQAVASLITGKTFSFDDILNKPVSPVLALTLILLNKGLINSKVFDDYLGDPNASVSNMFTPTVYAKSTSTVNDTNTEVIYGSTETYKKSLPPYYHIHGAYVNYGAPIDASKGTDPVYMNDGGNINLNGEQLRALNYLRNEGVLKKIADLPYGVKSSDINILRDGYGYGAICISTFLNILKCNKKVIPDIICGLLVSEDSGMTLGDAKRGIEEWLNPGYPNTGLLEFAPLGKVGTYKALEIIEEIGTYFFLSLLGHTFKKNIHFSIPMTSSQRNIFEAGYLLGDAMNDLRQYAKTIISQGLYKQKTFEVFSIYTPCVMTSDGQVSDSILEMGNYSKSFGDLTTMEDNPLTQVLGVKTCIDDIENLDYLINPVNGYKTHDFINKNLADHYINQLLGVFKEYPGEIISINKKLIQDNMLLDQGIAPRIESTSTTYNEYIFDHSKCHPIYDNLIYNSYENFKILHDTEITLTFQDSTKNTKLTQDIIKKLNSEYSDGTIASTVVDSLLITISDISDIDVDLNINGLNLSSTQLKLLKMAIKKNLTLTFKGKASSSPIADKSDISFGNITYNLTGFETLLNNTLYIFTNSEFTIETKTSGGVNALIFVFDKSKKWELNLPQHNDGVNGEITRKVGTDESNDINCSYISLENNINSLIKFQTMKLFKDNNCTLETYLYNINSLTDGEDKAKAVTTFIDVYGLAVCRIILINSFCNSYSLSLTASSDRYRKFFNVFTGFIEDMVDIDVTNLK